jgi:fused signal recognition particle receptor
MKKILILIIIISFCIYFIFKNIISHFMGNNITKKKILINNDLIQQIKKILINNDVGLEITNRMINKFNSNYKEETTIDILENFILNEMKDILKNQVESLYLIQDKFIKNHYGQKKPLVFLLIGNNGIGKTSFTGKLAQYFINNKVEKNKILLTSLDFFRAGAHEQLRKIGESIAVKVLPSKNNSKGQTYDAYKYAQDNDYDILIYDSAGRIHTNDNLLDEIKDIKETLDVLGAHTKTILVMDNNFGGISINSFMAFNDILAIDGIILTKMDTNIGGGWLVKLAENNKKIKLFGYVVGQDFNDFQDFNVDFYIKKVINLPQE